MAIILRRRINDVIIQSAVIDRDHLPSTGNCAKDVRYIKKENTFVIYTGVNWAEVELVLE